MLKTNFVGRMKFSQFTFMLLKIILSVSILVQGKIFLAIWTYSRVKIKLHKLQSIWVITFLGHNCHFVQNALIIFYAIFIQNSQFYSKFKPKSKAVEIFQWKISNFLMKFLILCLRPKIVISDFLCEIIPTI